MSGLFWSNTIWYLLLLLSSVVAIAVTFKKSHNRRFSSAFSLAVLGFTYCIEVSLLLVLNAYTYYPMLTPNDAFQDAVIGNFFSQISVTATAVLFSVLDLRSVFIFIFAGIYFLIDVLFVRLGIYEHHWYRSVYTLIGFIPYCYIVKKWYLLLLRAPQDTKLVKGLRGHKLKKWLHNATLFFAVFAAAGNSLITSQKLLELQIFKGGFFADMSKDHTTTSLIYGPILNVLFILLLRWKRPGTYKVGVLLILFACQWVLYSLGILTVPQGWFVIVTAIDLLGFYLWTVLLSRLLANPSTSLA